ncbi:Puff-specific protein Bx42 [Operophtera brumata]|uniref:Puff-specific protein Bx42 n=1 Tax=Operophtera brumata TaxID=104452 RepID=A0A0L7KXW7_OPEBR|nr:Puff-specific protein Bx42 [Operophtera brumata]
MEPPRFQINKKIPRAAPSPPAPVLHSPPRRVSVKQQRDWKVPPCVSHWKNAKDQQEDPRAALSPPAPVLHSPPRRVSVKQQRDWKVPPCVSHWKNAKGYTIPLDKRLAADGRGLQQVHINENFSKLAEALYIADRKIEHHFILLLERRLAQREKEKKEEHLRVLAQRARDHRAGIRAPEDDLETNEVDESGLTAAERDKLRVERHKDRQRERNIARAAPDKRYVDESGLTVAERDKLRVERHKDRQRERNIARVAPDKRYVHTRSTERSHSSRERQAASQETQGQAAGEKHSEGGARQESGLTAAERDKLRVERHKDRQRERNITRVAPDKRYVHTRSTERSHSGRERQAASRETQGQAAGEKHSEGGARQEENVGAHIYRPSRNQDKDNYGDLDGLANSRRYSTSTDQQHPTVAHIIVMRDVCVRQSRNQPEADSDPFGLDRFLSEAKRADKSSRKREHERRDQHPKKRRD